MRITSLIENDESPEHPELQAEFGLSLHVEHRGTKILFDTGSTGAFTKNADDLGVDLRKVDLAVLSHHHFDHGGGIEAFFERNSSAVVYLKRPGEGTPYARAFGVITRPIGIDSTLLERFADRFVFVDEITEVARDVFLIPEIISDHPWPKGNRHLFLRSEAGWKRDRFDHELILAVKEYDGIVVFTGCSHNGILNMIETVTDRFPGTPVKGVIGGFHLFSVLPFGLDAPGKRTIRQLGRRMLDYPDASYYTGHCTGERAFRILKGVMGDRLDPLATGTTIEL
jgi:7,8-dihydropterin-6-yl-methyl-4-(beta-D-ribofuranosyl)aminobenzene 5'-phosphate synthase